MARSLKASVALVAFCFFALVSSSCDTAQAASHDGAGVKMAINIGRGSLNWRLQKRFREAGYVIQPRTVIMETMTSGVLSVQHRFESSMGYFVATGLSKVTQEQTSPSSKISMAVGARNITAGLVPQAAAVAIHAGAGISDLDWPAPIICDPGALFTISVNSHADTEIFALSGFYIASWIPDRDFPTSSWEQIEFSSGTGGARSSLTIPYDGQLFYLTAKGFASALDEKIGVYRNNSQYPLFSDAAPASLFSSVPRQTTQFLADFRKNDRLVIELIARPTASAPVFVAHMGKPWIAF